MSALDDLFDDMGEQGWVGQDYARKGRDPIKFQDVEVLRTTEKALLCAIGSVEVWIPRSQLLVPCKLEDRGDEGLLMIPRWLAEAKELQFEEPV